jgi:hypothetical protein
MNSLRFLSNTELVSAQLDRETFAEPALNFEATSELVTEVGRSGAEVRLEGPAPPEDPPTIDSNSASLSQYQDGTSP